MCLVQYNFVLLTAEQSKLLMVKRYFHKAANRTRSSNVTATNYSGKSVALFQLRICVFLKILNIP